MDKPHIKVFQRLQKMYHFKSHINGMIYSTRTFNVFVVPIDEPYVLAWHLSIGNVVIHSGRMRFHSAEGADQLVGNIGRAMQRWVNEAAQDANMFANVSKGA